MFDGVPILIVEDEPFIAMDLADAVRTAGGAVIGPVSTVRQGLALLRDATVAGAILDCNLRDRDVTPLAEVLLAGGVPIVLFTAANLPAALEPRRGEVALLRKPAPPDEVVALLAALIAK
ncbi:response regulator [Emcibacter sp. SYSU 3D8]|uniref:response regulator n=1 Tax=Emcibacter sp. SYSU 3D8 TaxID=3133969 RepID=UPI0031FE918E